MYPEPSSARNSPLQGVLLTNADLDHTLGLLSLREGENVRIHASRSVWEYLSVTLAFNSILEAFCGVTWFEPPLREWASLVLKSGQPSGLSYRAIPMRSSPPMLSSAGSSIDVETHAFLVKDERTGRVLLAAPDVFEINRELEDALAQADAVLFDGTFWSEHELGQVKASARVASAMGHLPIHGGSLERLACSPARIRIYLHINNTNLILFPGSAERKAVEAAGITVGYDGLEFDL